MQPPKVAGKTVRKSRTVVRKSRNAQKNIKFEKKKEQKKREVCYAEYIYRGMKLVHADIGVSPKATNVMNVVLNHIFELIVGKASKITKRRKKSIMSSREIQAAVKSLVPGDLATHAVIEGNKALRRYTSSEI